VLGWVLGVVLVVVVDLRSSELKTWPFWRTRARGSAMMCGYGFVGTDSWLVRGGVVWIATRESSNALLGA